MLGTERKSDGQQYAVRKSTFEMWMKRERPQQWQYYVDELPYGGPSMWLNYLWLDGDTYRETGGMVNCVVPVADRRCYFRTYLAAVVQNIPFELIDNFSDDTSPVYESTQHDGRMKLNALLGVIQPGDKVIYLGSGAQTVETAHVSTYAELKLVDPYLADRGILSTFPLDTEVVINDAYYEGFEVDQLRLVNVPRYFAKQEVVAEDDFLFILPGSSEARYTNDERFLSVFTLFLAKLISCRTRDEAAFFSLDTVLYRSAKNLAQVDSLGSRIELKNVTSLSGEEIPYRACALFLPFENYICGGVLHGKDYIVSEYREKPVEDDVASYMLQLLRGHDKKDITNKKKKKKNLKANNQTCGVQDDVDVDVVFFKEELKKYTAFAKLNWQLVRGLESVVVNVYPCEIRRKMLEKCYTLPFNGVTTPLMGVKELVPFIVSQFEDGDVVLHAYCGDGEYTTLLEAEAFKKNKKNISFIQHDSVDVRISKKKKFYSQLIEADWIILRHALHSRRVIENDLRTYNVLIVDFDVKTSRLDVEHIHELGLCKCGGQIDFSFGIHDMRGFEVRIRGATFGQFLCMRRRLRWDDG